MTKREHTDSYARLCREVQARYWWATWAPVLRTVLAGLGLAGALWLAALSGDCGDIRDAGADPEPAAPPVDHAALAFARGYADGIDAQAFALAARFEAWQPTWRERHPGELAEVTSAVLLVCRASPWPTAERCPDLLLALAFKESSLRANARGRRGEIGLVQLMPGVATAGETREAAADPETNLRLGLAYLRRCALLCRMADKPNVEAALSVYAGLRCGPSRGGALVLRWEAELREAGGGT